MLEAIANWDASVLLNIQEHVRADWLDPIMKFITHLGGGGGVLWITLCILLMIPKKTRRIGIVAAMALAFSFICNNLIIKNVVGRIRPYDAVEGLICLVDHPIDSSFPSGHTACAFSVTTGILLVSHKMKPIWPKIVLIVLAFAIAFSRLYVGVHYPSDVITAMITAPICAVAMYFLFRFIEKKLKKRKEEKDDMNAMMV